MRVDTLRAGKILIIHAAKRRHTESRPFRPYQRREEIRLGAPKLRWWILSIAAAVLLIIYFVYTPIISAIIATRVHEAIDRRLHAELQYDSLTYIFPYRVRLRNVQLRTDASLGNELLRVELLDLQLAKLPLPHRPLVIKSLLFQSPELHIVKNPTGVAGASGLVKRDAEMKAAPPEHRLSEMFELRQFKIDNGKVVYEDHTIAGITPLVYSGITIDLGVTPKERSLYAYQFETRQPPLVDIAADGTIDIDSLVLAFSHLTMRAQVHGATDQSPLPPQVQQAINQLGIAGAISIAGSGELPLSHAGDASFTGDVSIDNGRANFGSGLGQIDQLDAKTRLEIHGGEGQTDLTSFVARSGATRLTLNEMIAQIGRSKWNVPSISGTIDATAPRDNTACGDSRRYCARRHGHSQRRWLGRFLLAAQCLTHRSTPESVHPPARFCPSHRQHQGPASSHAADDRGAENRRRCSERNILDERHDQSHLADSVRHACAGGQHRSCAAYVDAAAERSLRQRQRHRET